MTLNIKEMTESTLARSVASRNSDQALFDSIAITYGYEVIQKYGVVKFCNDITRYRREFQKCGMYEAKKDVKESRRTHSKFWKSEMLEGQKKTLHELNLRKKMK